MHQLLDESKSKIIQSDACQFNTILLSPNIGNLNEEIPVQRTKINRKSVLD